jgi:hypothetical protein
MPDLSGSSAPFFGPGTWPVELGNLGASIDHILVSGGAALTSLSAMPDHFGSNHRGLVANETGSISIKVHTTNAIEAQNSKLRRAVRARDRFPSADAATKLMYLILNRPEKEWKCRHVNGRWPRHSLPSSSERFIRAMAA